MKNKKRRTSNGKTGRDRQVWFRNWLDYKMKKFHELTSCEVYGHSYEEGVCIYCGESYEEEEGGD